jgi:pimeloyl-ACP methyl ester carboxylesterase
VVNPSLEKNNAPVFRVATAGERRQLAHIPGAKFIVLSETAHSIDWEQPEAFKRNVVEFIQGWR